MGYRLVPLLLLAIVAGGCGKEIGDSCTLSTDCDPNGTRICDPDPSSKDGYCTIQGCDYSTCPGEAACIRFFSGSFSSRTCASTDECVNGRHNVPEDPANPNYDGTLDELCSVGGYCVSRSSEVRFCMRKCGSDDDCRDGYECRGLQKMKDHGGEPVLAPGLLVDDKAPKFCAMAPVTP